MGEQAFTFTDSGALYGMAETINQHVVDTRDAKTKSDKLESELRAESDKVKQQLANTIALLDTEKSLRLDAVRKEATTMEKIKKMEAETAVKFQNMEDEMDGKIIELMEVEAELKDKLDAEHKSNTHLAQQLVEMAAKLDAELTICL